MKRAVVPAVDPEWNERQRRVLDLLAKGATNPEIAAALGITLDGAKWHVSDILSRLGVDAREEAAEYWRARNGLGSRLRRFARGALPSSAVGRWLAGGGSAAAIAVGVAVVVVVLVSQGGEDEPASVTPTETTTPAATAVPTPQAGISAPDPARPAVAIEPPGPLSRPGVIDAVLNGGTLTVGAPWDTSTGAAVYYFPGCFSCGGGRIDLYRYVRTASGERTDFLFGPLLPSDAFWINSIAIDPTSGAIWAARCVVSENCIGAGSASPNPPAQVVFVSRDGGISWSEAGRGPADMMLTSVRAGSPAYGRWTEGLTRSYLLDGTLIAPPGGDQSLYPLNVPGIGPVWWRRADSTYLDSAGQVLVTIPDLPAPLLKAKVGAGFVVTWGDLNHRPHLSVVDASGFVLKDWMAPMDLKRNTYVGLSGHLVTPDGTEWLTGSAILPDPPADRYLQMEAAFVDLTRGQIRPLPGVSETMNRDGYPYVQHVALGPFARVTGASDCLNVREQPATAAAILGCYRDNVILRLREGEPAEADGITWLPVATPDGRPGWASAQYLER